ncbi:rho GTPase-activating protein 28 isoform X1 [Amblyraja radiata]|uniref:rho GTPase-activating protein 28 isoform X1 n=2 Tax=Amblyraja radiata TaxID=386614 RepID=UPI001401CB4E|nr:rho GTPase-activating protein 28 isoform X1 [Amblyraja radiata]
MIMEINDSGSVVLTAYHSYSPSRIPLMDRRCVTELPSSLVPTHRKLRFRRMSSSVSRELQCPQVFGRSISQESVESSSMEDFWSEVRSIKESRQNGQEEQPLVEVKPSEEGEMEAEWLQEVGLSTLVSGTAGENGMALLSTLTRAQAAAVQRRLDTFTQTTRRRSKQPVRDVRDVFGPTDSPARIEFMAPESTPTSNGVQQAEDKTSWNPTKENIKNDAIESQQSNAEITEDLNWDIPYSESLMAAQKLQRPRTNCIKRPNNTMLPKFTIPKDRLGLTQIGDLSCQDMKKIHNLALIEITTFYDALGLDLKRSRLVKVKAKETGLFGVPLTTLLENDQKKVPGTKIPLIFQKLLSKMEETGLDAEGILRVPGSASRVKNYRQELESKFYEAFDWDQVHHNDVAGLLKTFIRELPYPLLTAEYLPAFIAVQNISQTKLQLQALHLIIMLLPDLNRDTIKAFLEYLSKVVANEAKNRMSLWNVSMIVAPNLFMCKGRSGNHQEAEAATKAAKIVQLLIKYQDILWTIPSFVLAQVRKMNENETRRRTRVTWLTPPSFFFPPAKGNCSPPSGSSSRGRSRNQEPAMWDVAGVNLSPSALGHSFQLDIPEGVIRVYATKLSKVSMAIQLDSETKASDILARFHCETSTYSTVPLNGPSHYLFEIGGNIGERCLDLNTYILDLYRLNPNAAWVIKPRTL